MPRKADLILPEIAFLLLITGMDFGYIWVIENREIHDSVDIAKNIGSYVMLFFFTLICILMWVFTSRRVKTEYQKRAERLERIPEADFWDLDAEVSMSELQYGSFYLLKDYLYAPAKRLLIRYEEIDTWRFADYISTLSGRIENQFLDIVEKDGFRTQIIIRQRQQLTQERDALRMKLDDRIRNAKHNTVQK